ncbi:beta-lactamase/transpeptidase-like protein [Aspergillus heteromorphus CBS 117.55]|uniref:Beta-lactamase/transpeptidase-like protein n=1 Tax=Aspergillus heteromorphus CBS 117.55 TaxID=1448321 RepID=A0A317WQI2_9EURO|nr:beta-lactamase/transpeptidase-like protein [Aspergillus heteromorphus CBS 117.55]PWY87387.1 beta-lactamase/transpeptidase-like protein [Aspergillus heteromorphus CBS 117.55]
MSSKHIQDILEAVPARYRGPGGAVAVLQEGRLVAQHAWGYADLQARTLMTPATLMPVCSITKQMVCLILTDLARNPTPAMVQRGSPGSQQLADALDQILPRALPRDPGGLQLEHLCHNQSGLRDYWAMSALWGSRPDARFTVADDARQALDRTRSLHFEPGTQYAYCNLNFHILARVAETVSGQSLGDLLADRLFAPARMATAALCPDNAALPPPCVGYEGDEAGGFVPAVNRMQWSGDAGVVASLEDMVAYEQYLDRSWDDPGSLYRAIADAPSFKDGTPARYGYGLEHRRVGSVPVIGHGGALRGFRLHRFQAHSERMAVVVMLNHERDAEEVAGHILSEALRLPTPRGSTVQPAAGWTGTFFDPEARLIAQTRPGGPGRAIVSYAGADEVVGLLRASHGESSTLQASLTHGGETLVLHRLEDNRHIRAQRIPAGQAPPRDGDGHGHGYTGRYHCADVDSTFHCTGAGGMLYGSFDGYLGEGPAHLMRYVGQDIWALSCPRGLDAPAPGDWTLVFQRDKGGRVVGVEMGCWLARGVVYARQ